MGSPVRLYVPLLQKLSVFAVSGVSSLNIHPGRPRHTTTTAGWCTEPMEISARGAGSVPASARSTHVTAADAVIDIGCASAVAAHSTNNKAAHPRIVSLPRAGLPAVRAFRALGCAGTSTALQIDKSSASGGLGRAAFRQTSGRV